MCCVDRLSPHRVSAAEIETAVVDQLRGLLRSPEVVIGTWRSAKPVIDGLSEANVREVLAGLDPLWDELFPAEQTRIIQLLVERIDIGTDGLDIRLRTPGLASLVTELRTVGVAARRVA
jgi:site-specific DNA recombinase